MLTITGEEKVYRQGRGTMCNVQPERQVNAVSQFRRGLQLNHFPFRSPSSHVRAQRLNPAYFRHMYAIASHSFLVALCNIAV